MASPLDNLTGAGGSLSREPADRAEFIGLRNSGIDRLRDAGNESLSMSSRFDLAYNAGHALCLAALRHQGYRPSHRYIVFQVLPHTLGLGPAVWRILDRAHQQRNLGEYEGHLEVDERFLKDLVRAVDAVAQALTGLEPP